ncbi:serine hydrolase [Natrononativus amylolyticus]|uniref:serine hydrolase n=1 Tax=Natrononativus amylolyticus TaxID=2963434 RepID=UPI0020CD1AF6|nr:serine hydrolase [Natrononativus amylolyticus]
MDGSDAFGRDDGGIERGRTVARPPPSLRSAAELGTYVDAVADGLEGRLGVYVGDADAPEGDPIVARAHSERFGSASVVKLLLLYALYERYDGRLEELSERGPISPENRVGGAGLFHLLESPRPTLEECAYAMIAISDNTATNELIDHLGLERIAACADRLGLEGTALRRKMMRTEPLAGASVPEGPYLNTVTPLDCARLLGGIHRGERLSPAASERLLVPLAEQTDASMAARYLPTETDDVEIAHKTGSIESVAADAGLLTVGDRTLVYAVCTDRLAHWGYGTDAVAGVGEAVYRLLAR